MDKKLHIKAVANQNIKIDAYWFTQGDKIDCYVTPAHFKNLVNAFSDFDIILDEEPKKEEVKSPEKKEEVVKDELRKPRLDENNNSRKGTKKTV